MPRRPYCAFLKNQASAFVPGGHFIQIEETKDRLDERMEPSPLYSCKDLHNTGTSGPVELSCQLPPLENCYSTTLKKPILPSSRVTCPYHASKHYKKHILSCTWPTPSISPALNSLLRLLHDGRNPRLHLPAAVSPPAYAAFPYFRTHRLTNRLPRSKSRWRTAQRSRAWVMPCPYG